MKILRLTPHFYWPHGEMHGWPVKYDAIGGMQSQIYGQTKALADLGYEQTVLTLKIPNFPKVWEMSPGTSIRGVRVPVLPFRSRIRGMMDLNISWVLGVLKHIISHKKDFDLVHIHCSGVFWPLILGRLVGKWFKKKTIFTIHCSIIATYHPMNLLDRIIFPIAKRIESSVIKSAAHNIFLTERSREIILQHLGLNLEDISSSIAPDIIDIENFRSFASKKNIQDLKSKYNLPAGKKIIGYVGRVAREKGWRCFVAMAQMLVKKRQDIHFLVVGNGNEFDLLKRMISKEKIALFFTLTDYLPHRKIPAALSLLSVLVMTSNHEELGSILIEAMSMSVPVIAFNVGGIQNVVKHRVNGLLTKQGCIKGLAENAETILNNTELAESLAKEGLREVKKKYELHNQISTISDVYDALEGEKSDSDFMAEMASVSAKR